MLLLAVLATLQYRWIAQLSEAERTRLEANLHRATEGFCKDFDHEVARAFVIFNLEQPHQERELPDLLADRMLEWRSSAAWPEMVKELFVIRHQTADEVEFLCFDLEKAKLLRCKPDAEMLPILRRLPDPRRMPVIDGVLPGLVLAIQELRPPGVDGPFEWQPPRDHLVVRFDLDFITGTLLPHLAATHFADDTGLGYALRVSTEGGKGPIVFQSGSPAAASYDPKPDATASLLGLRAFEDISDPAVGHPPTARPPPPRRNQQHGDRTPPQNPPAHDPIARTEAGRWLLAVHHPAGSLEQVVASARRRNMAISLATLALLGVTALLILLSTRRAQRLARQQMDFVAAISHELRTPLTAIRSAGQNLADGIIAEAPRVRSYGLLIEREGRRLTEMIGRVLTYAGIRSGRQAFRMAPVELAGIVEAALADCRWILDEKDLEVESEIEPELPPVQGDAGALRLVFANLIDNAIKYGAAGRWLGVQGGFESAQGAGEVWIAISDRGPGITRRERHHLFEPFWRGADAASGTVPGSGLGLAVVRGVVEAHGGRIDVSSSPEGGTTFKVRFPAVRPESHQEDGR